METDLAGLVIGGGIGVLDTLRGVEPGDVGLIAPAGSIDAGDAGIRVSGNLSLSAMTILNAPNIQVVGSSTGMPGAAVSGLSLITTSNSWNTADTENPMVRSLPSPPPQSKPLEVEAPSIITVEIIGYGDAQGRGIRNRKKGLTAATKSIDWLRDQMNYLTGGHPHRLV